jgi:hypothetical protein
VFVRVAILNGRRHLQVKEGGIHVSELRHKRRQKDGKAMKCRCKKRHNSE